MRQEKWLVWVLMLAFITMNVFAAAPRMYNMLTGPVKAYEQTIQSSDNTVCHQMTADADNTQSSHSCCSEGVADSNCMMNGCLLMMVFTTAIPTFDLAHAVNQFTYAGVLPLSPYFPLLIPPIA